MRHEIEERRSKALRREEEGNASDGDIRIDLDSGFVHIVADGQAAATADADEVSDPDGDSADTDPASSDN